MVHRLGPAVGQLWAVGPQQEAVDSLDPRHHTQQGQGTLSGSAARTDEPAHRQDQVGVLWMVQGMRHQVASPQQAEIPAHIFFLAMGVVWCGVVWWGTWSFAVLACFPFLSST